MESRTYQTFFDDVNGRLIDRQKTGEIDHQIGWIIQNPSWRNTEDYVRMDESFQCHAYSGLSLAFCFSVA